jgi:PDDEXK-like domain of unknown function (DUF3799)
MEPGIWDISDDAYQNDPCKEVSLRASLARILVSPGGTPRHAWWQTPRLNPQFAAENNRRFDIGKAVHKIVLGKGAEFVEIQCADYKKEIARLSRDAAWDNGKIPLLTHELAMVNAMATAAHEQVDALVTAGTIEQYPFRKNETEKTLIWRDGKTDVLCRARLDGLPDDHEAINEFKTTNASADPALWQWRQMRPLGFAFSLAFYRRGLEALGLAFSPSFRFFVQETEPPYCLSFIRVDDELIALEDQRVTQALRIWKRCRETNEWPSYSAHGYDISLSERERTKEAVAEPQAEHLASEDAARDLKPSNLFPRRK